MAPELIPFFGFGVLFMFLVVLMFLAFRFRTFRVIAVLAAVVVFGLLVLAGRFIRQQYFLNEPLVCAAEDGDLKQVEYLMSWGAWPDSRGVDFANTALIGAIRGGHFEIVQVLLDKGADVRLTDWEGKSALDWAKESGDVRIRELVLETDGASGN